ncbi:hypothetical protein [Catellatospora sp. NPDC049133]|uniref:hypothetical protein n=1 Tax=Catellatospora sp. NPDC049133 TaxID=3155499 RepID=UPI0033F2E553
MYQLTSAPEGRSVPVDSYHTEPGSRTARLQVTLGIGDKVVDTEVVESSEAVTVTVKVQESSETREDIGIPTQVDIVLSEPIGDRRVVNSIDGATIPAV